MPFFEIDADISKARTIDTRFYTDAEWFEYSKEAIFARTWQFAGLADDLKGLTPIELLPHILDEPLLIIERDNVRHCVSNVCTHRGKVLVERQSNADLIRCGYHGRRFDLDGRFLSMPEFDEVKDFPSPCDDLAAIPYAEFAGFAFVSPDPKAKLPEFVGGAGDLITPVEHNGLKLAAKREYTIDAHWALYCENYLEGFHIPYVHKSLNQIVDYGTYTTETFRYSSLQTGFDDTGNIAAKYLFIFPGMMLNFYSWGVSVNVVRPLSPNRTTVEFLTYLKPGAVIGDGAGGDLHTVEMEDEQVVESVQRGIRSRYYNSGRYSPSREQGTHHFHRLIAEFID